MRRPPSSRNLAPLAALSILLVDDNRLNQKVGTKILKQLGLVPDIAGNGIDAIQACVDTCYDVVLMDIEMPDMDGMEAARKIREARLDRAPFIIALTANAMASDRERYLEAGLDDYLSKPLEPELLVASLQRAGDHWAGRRSNGAERA